MVKCSSTYQNLRIIDKVYVRIRLATKSDISHIYKLFYEIHEFHSYTHLYKVNKDSLCNMLFETNPRPPFYSPTILLVEVSATEFPAPSPDDDSGFEPITNTFSLKDPIVDEECEEFISSAADHKAAYIAGYAFFFPNYSCFYDRPGIFLDSLYFRAGYRTLGFGHLVFSIIAANAATKGFSSIEEIVAVWNTKSRKFFVDMGVDIMDEFRYAKLTGQAFQAYANKFMARFGGIRAKM